MKKVVLVIYSCKLRNKKELDSFEKDIRNDILAQDNNLCVEFYNLGMDDPYKTKFNKILKSRKPSSTLFYECCGEDVEKVLKVIEERVAEEVIFFFKNLRNQPEPDEKIRHKIKKVESAKEVPIFTTTV